MVNGRQLTHPAVSVSFQKKTAAGIPHSVEKHLTEIVKHIQAPKPISKFNATMNKALSPKIVMQQRKPITLQQANMIKGGKYYKLPR